MKAAKTSYPRTEDVNELMQRLRALDADDPRRPALCGAIAAHPDRPRPLR